MLFSSESRPLADDEMICKQSRCPLDSSVPLSIFVMPQMAFIGVLFVIIIITTSSVRIAIHPNQL
jgi:hypothetical protein